MEITGTLIKILPETRGESQRGPWVRGGFVIQTDGEYPRQVAFDTFGEDRVAMVQNTPMNTPVVVTFMPESREFNDKWYTNLRCSRIQNYVPGQMPPQAPVYGWPAAPAAPVTPGVQPAAPQAPAQPTAPVQQAAAPQAEAPAFASPLKPDEDLPF